MRILIAAVGKPRDAALSAAIADYETRAARYWPLSAHEVREGSTHGPDALLVKNHEAERLVEKLPGSGLVITCDVEGRSMTTAEFARWLSTQRDQARDVAFVIGGAFGLGDAIKKAATWSLCLAPWTLPHELARLVLAEQIYRAGTIMRGEPYHK
jgi:23S rRNA (pseudouridine1915-N3)-methyltransferase